MFGNGAYLTIWEVKENDNYSIVSVSSSKKNRQTNEYETDFSSNYVRFVGDAHLCRPQKGQKIKVVDCGVQNCYVKNGKKESLKNPTYCVFKYELQEDTRQSSTTRPPLELIEDNQLPF